MGSKSTDEATFRINIDGNAAEATKSISTNSRQAAQAIALYESNVKDLSADLRRLRGNSEQVTSAKKELKAKIDAARTSASTLTAELVKQGISYRSAADAAKKYKDATKGGVAPNLRSAIGKVGSLAAGGLGAVGRGVGAKLAPVGKKLGELFAPMTKALGSKLAPLGQKLGTFGKAAKEDLGSLASAIGPMLGEVLVGGATLAAASAAAMAAAFIGATVALAAFSLATADAYAKMNRQREALLGTAKDAQALGDQIGALAGKVPQGVAELNQMSLALSKTRISGKATVDALNAIAQVSGAVDASAGEKIQELITQNAKFGHMAIGMFDLDGTGLDFNEVAKAYADGTHKSVEAAVRELRTGRAPIEAGSKALRDAAEKKFGKLNIANAFSLENAPTKFFDQLKSLSSDVDLGPISSALQDAFGQLSPNAPLGAGVKEFMTVFGGALVDVAKNSIPVLLEGFKWMVVWGLRISTVFVKTFGDIRDAFNGSSNWFEGGQRAGGALILGLIKGIVVGTGAVEEALWSLGKDSLTAFKNVLGIHSPSKVFAELGRNTTEGYAQGIERGSRRAAEASQDMASASANGAAQGGASSGGGAPIHLVVNINGAPTGDAKAMGSPAFMSALTQAIRDSLSQRGLATP